MHPLSIRSDKFHRHDHYNSYCRWNYMPPRCFHRFLKKVSNSIGRHMRGERQTRSFGLDNPSCRIPHVWPYTRPVIYHLRNAFFITRFDATWNDWHVGHRFRECFLMTRTVAANNKFLLHLTVVAFRCWHCVRSIKLRFSSRKYQKRVISFSGSRGVEGHKSPNTVEQGCFYTMQIEWTYRQQEWAARVSYSSDINQVVRL